MRASRTVLVISVGAMLLLMLSWQLAGFTLSTAGASGEPTVGG